jgi:uncharacterized protein YdiU (UPF0061 family)
MIKDLQQFIKDIILKADMKNLPKSFLDEYEEKLMIEAQRRLGVLMTKELDEKGIKAFNELMQKNSNPDQKALLDFFNVYIPNFEQKMEKGLREFAQEFIDGLKQLKTKVNKTN